MHVFDQRHAPMPCHFDFYIAWPLDISRPASAAYRSRHAGPIKLQAAAVKPAAYCRAAAGPDGKWALISITAAQQYDKVAIMYADIAHRCRAARRRQRTAFGSIRHGGPADRQNYAKATRYFDAASSIQAQTRWRVGTRMPQARQYQLL